MIDIGAPAMSFLDMLRQTARVLGLRRLIVPVPLLSPRLSSYWLTLMTPVPSRWARPWWRAQVRDPGAERPCQPVFPGNHPGPFDESVRRAMDELENDLVISRWCDSSAGIACDIPEQSEPGRTIFRDQRQTSFAGLPAAGVRGHGQPGRRERLVRAQLPLAGARPLDKLVGGYGLNRGRRVGNTLRVGDALDFWKVADIVPNKRLLLLAQMKLPGKAWLEFDLQGETLTQTAHFIPHGLFGRLYWYAVLPFHHFVFADLCKGIIDRAATLGDTPEQAEE